MTDDKININDIISTYYSFKEILKHDNFDLYFADVLRRVLEKTKNKIGNVQDIINTTINNDYKISTSPTNETKIIHKKLSPQWLKKQNINDQSILNIEDEKREFENLIAKFKE